MTSGFRCPECGAPNRLFDAMNQSVLAIAGELRLTQALQRIVDGARDLVGAGFAAVGVLGADGRFSEWVSSRGTDRPTAIPPTDGALGHVLRLGTTWSTCDVASEVDAGAWPAELPAVRSLLAVPIFSDSEVLGAFYLGNEDHWGFSGDARWMIELVAPHAAGAIANARLHARSRELSVVEERTRLARELHDSVTQALFSIRLAADTALLTADAEAVREHVEQVRELSRTALGEMRALISELRPPDIEAKGIVETLLGHAAVLRQVHGLDVQIEATLEERLDARCEAELFRLAQEALANAVRHAHASGVQVQLVNGSNTVRLTVSDDGRGFDASAASGRGYGLVTMRERAEALGGSLTITSAPAQGTVVSVEVPR